MYKILAVLAMVAGVAWFSYGAGVDSVRADMAEKVKIAVEAARADEQIKQAKINKIAQEQYNEIAIINSRLNTDLDKLRDRPSRGHLPNGTGADCKGVTGQHLSSQDSGFLVREAARADKLRTALKACYNYADSVSGAN
jgi:predicted transglutaminase-like cysteine proteinase